MYFLYDHKYLFHSYRIAACAYLNIKQYQAYDFMFAHINI